MRRHIAIVPAYNEAESISSTIADLRRHAPEFDVLVIDDGSTDETARVARQAGATVIRHPFNLGIGGAVQSGYVYALEHGYDRAIQFDGDGQHQAAEIPKLLAELDKRPEMNMIVGSRFLAADYDGYRSSASRRVGIRIFAWVLSRIVGAPVTDPTSGFRLVTRRGIELFARDYPHDYPEVEAILLLHAHKLNSAEVPVKMRARTGGVSSINAMRSAYYMVKVLLAVFVGLFRARPNVEAGDQAPVVAEHGI